MSDDQLRALMGLAEMWSARSYRANRDGDPAAEVLWEHAADELVAALGEAW